MEETKTYRTLVAVRELRRTAVITIRITEDERNRLKALARERNLTLSVLSRHLLMGRVPPSVTDRQFAQELGRVGNNLNQVARALNTGFPPGSEGLRRELQELRALLLRVQQELRCDRQTDQRD